MGNIQQCIKALEAAYIYAAPVYSSTKSIKKVYIMFVICQPVHSLRHPYISWISLFMETFTVYLCYAVADLEIIFL